MKKRLWIFQTNLSGNANGHFEMLELPINSTRSDVKKYADKWAFKCFNIQDLGVFKSMIRNVDFCPESVGSKIKIKTKKKKQK